jgi:hypothetical protein
MDLAKAGAMLREAGFLGCASDPVECHGHRDRAGRVRRMHATYENAWRATLVLRVNGDYSLSQALKLVGRKAEA